MIKFHSVLMGIAIFGTSLTIAAQATNSKKLHKGFSIESPITADQQKEYSIQLKNGEAIIGTLMQKGIDLVVAIHAPNGKLIKQIDSPNGSNGPEPIDFTANSTGNYTFIIRSLDKKANKGNYSLDIEKLLNLTENIKRITKKELPTKTLYNLWEASLTNKNAIDNFIEKHQQKHIIEPIEGDTKNMLVTYFCVPTENTEYVMQSGGPDFLGLRFQQLPNTKLFYVTQRVPKDARFNYGFNYFTINKAGPNGEIVSRNVVHAYDGTVEMPNAPKQTYTIKQKNVPKGKLLPTAIRSNILNEERKITIHTPANYNPKTPHNLLIVFDGEAYGGRPNRRSRIPTPTIMDNLMFKEEIPKTITVLVWSMRKRSRDLPNISFGDFIADELIPYMRKNYTIASGAKHVILAGSSRGGFAASYIALRHSNVIGNVLSQSGSYWIKADKNENHWIYPENDGKLISLYKQSKKLPIKFYMDVGLYDAGASMLGMNRQFRDILELKGYLVDYYEFKGGHSYTNWRGTFAKGLKSLTGTKK